MSLVVREQVCLGELTTLKVGGCARYSITVTTVEELRAAVVFAQQKQLPFFVIGGGSNLLASDSGYHGVIIRMQILGRQYEESVEREVVNATFGAGEVLDVVIADTVALGYWGLENLSHIPGTVGATPVQNVGAYGVEMSDCVTSVTVYDAEQDVVHFMTSDECQFQYRDSVFKKNSTKHMIIIAVTVTLSKTPQPKIQYGDLAVIFHTVPATQQAIREAVITIRTKKFPNWHEVGTAGSFFKNPIVTTAVAETFSKRYPEAPVYPVSPTASKLSLGYILDKICGLKGYRIGPVSLYTEQALVLVADIGATAADIEHFVVVVTKRVYECTQIQIEREVTELT